MIKAAIFDLDGVVIDSEPSRLTTYKILFEELYGINIEFEPDELIGRSETENLQYLLKKYKLKGNITFLINKRYKLLIYVAENQAPAIIPVIEFLKYLKNKSIPTALATNSYMDYVEAVMSRLDLGRYFDVIITGDQVKRPKPDPEVFLVASQRLQTSPEQCLVFEDSPAGIEGARRAGMRCVGVFNSHADPLIMDVEAFIVVNEKLPSCLFKFFESYG